MRPATAAECNTSLFTFLILSSLVVISFTAGAQQSPMPDPIPASVSPMPVNVPPAPVLTLAEAMQAPLGRRTPDEPPTLDAQQYTITVHSPFKSIAKVRLLLNEIALDLVTQLGYSESIAAKGESRTAGLAGIAEQRFFMKKASGQESRRTIELDLIQNSSGKYDILIYGVLRDASGEKPNPDLIKFMPTVTMLFNEAETADSVETRGPVGHFLYQLSYIQADQAMGILKALGYASVEFSKHPGASIWENLYEPIKKGEVELPLIIKFIEGSKMSLMEPAEGAAPPQMGIPGMTGARTAIPDIGGTFLHHMTTGEPEQRLLIVYDQEQPEAMQFLLNMLRETIDVPARQVVISALVVEINSERSKELGLNFAAGNGRNRADFPADPTKPFTFTFDSSVPSGAFTFSATLSALIRKGEAEVLSNPSVLVLDGRQARIQIGKQVPVVNSTATAAGITSSVEYFPVGIVLNLRPRINEEGTEVTMQVETIVSAVGQNAGSTSDVFFAPTIDNRQVQTFVRVADNTPFIIGGLISSDKHTDRSGVPLLSRIPYLGALFRKDSSAQTKKEVIVVLTPRIIPPDQPSFSYVIPKDSEILDTFGHKLFRNAYRIRSEDVHDLHFVDDSEVFQTLLARVRSQAARQPAIRTTEPFASLLAGRIPGEEVLVHRMLWEIINRSGIAGEIDPQRITLFHQATGDANPRVGQLSNKLAALNADKNALVLAFESAVGTSEHPFAQPEATVSYEHVEPGGAEQLLLARNTRKPDGRPDQSAIVISLDTYGGVAPLDVLRGVLVLKKVLALNSGVAMTLKNFHVGRQIIFPTEQDIRQATHVIDRQTAQLFFEVVEYYRAFETEFNRKTHEAFRAMSLQTNP